MRRAILPVLVLALAAAPMTASAQRPVPERGRMAAGPMLHRAPVARILAQREALGLSAAQVARLEEIQATLASRNRPLMERLRAALPDSGRTRALRGAARERAPRLTPEQRAEMRERMAQLTPEQRAALREQMREQMRERVAEMTPEQRAQMRERMEQRRAESRERAAQRPRLSQEQQAVVRPLMEELRDNTRQAMRDAQAVLTAEQKERLRERHDGAARVRGLQRGPGRSPDGR